VLSGLSFYRCEACNREAVSIPCKPDLHRVLAKALFRKPGLLTGAEARYLRTFTGVSALAFAEELGVTSHTLLSWERAERLRYRDDFCIRTVSAALSLGSHLGHDIIWMAKAIRERKTEAYEIRAEWLEEEKHWSLISIS